MSDLLSLNPDAPHSPERTAALGALLATTARALAYATMEGRRGLETPADAYALLGDLTVAAARLPQLTVQLGAFLRRLEAAGRLADDRGDPSGCADRAAVALVEAADLARSIAAELGAAQNAVAGLRIKEENDG